MEELTIFTPTFNREKLLTKAYNSLLNQTNKNFIWLIVDDGSTDKTINLINEWINEGKIKIEYYKKKNGGKHTAYNYALEYIHTKYVLICLDSDDYLMYDAVETYYTYITQIKKEVGIVTPRISLEEPKKLFKDINILNGKSLSYALKNNLLNIETEIVFKTEYLKNFRYPEYDNENFFTEAYIYYKMDKPMIWVNKPTCILEYQNDGMTKNIIKSYIKNPNSWYQYNKLRMNINESLIVRIKSKILYIFFGRKLKKDITINNNYFETILLYPLALIIDVIIRCKTKGDNNEKI